MAATEQTIKQVNSLGNSEYKYGFSTELDEILAVSDRIAVICGGKIAGIVPADTSRLKIGSLMAGSHAAI